MALTDAGLTVDSLDTILARVQAELLSTFGQDFDVTPGSDAIRLIFPVLTEIDLVLQLAQQLYDSFDRSRAQGLQLDNLGRLVGVYRDAGATSTGTLTITGDAGTVIAEGFVVRSSVTGALFVTTDPATLPDTGAPAGTETVAVAIASQDVGAITASAGSLTEIITPVTGVASVTNAAAVTPGRPRASDSEFRVAIAQGLQGGGAGTLGSLYAAVLAVSAVQAVVVLNNPSDSTDADGVPPRSVRVVVYPTLVDADDQIAVATVLAEQATPALTYDGTETFTASTADGLTLDVAYSYATARPLRWKATVTAGADYPADGDDLVQAQIGKWFGLVDIAEGEEIVRYAVGQDILVQEVLCSILDAVPGVRAVALAVDDVATDPPLITTILDMGSTQVGTVTSLSLIEVTS